MNSLVGTRVWLVAESSRVSREIFTEFDYLGWIRNWFVHADGVDEDDFVGVGLGRVECEVNRVVMERFFHDCLSLCLDAEAFLGECDYLLDDVSLSDDDDVLCVVRGGARKVIVLLLNSFDDLSDVTYTFGYEV